MPCVYFAASASVHATTFVASKPHAVNDAGSITCLRSVPSTIQTAPSEVLPSVSASGQSEPILWVALSLAVIHASSFGKLNPHAVRTAGAVTCLKSPAGDGCGAQVRFFGDDFSSTGVPSTAFATACTGCVCVSQ